MSTTLLIIQIILLRSLRKKYILYLNIIICPKKALTRFITFRREVVLILTSVGLCVIFRYVFYLSDVSIQYVGLSLKLHILTNCLLNILLSEISILI